MVGSTSVVNPGTCLITGTTHGIGRPTARGIAEAGFKVVMACRDVDRAEALRAQLTDATGNADIHVLECDLASFDSIRTAAAAFATRFDSLELLINNAGTMVTPRQTSRDGVEMTFAVNHLGPYLLTRLLLPTVLTSKRARIVNVASKAHYSGSIDLSTLSGESPARPRHRGMQTYSNSKLGTVMFTLALADRLPADHVTANCLHPGVIGTNIMGAANAFYRIGMKIASPFMLNEKQGARTTLALALDPRFDGVSGKYFDKGARIVEPAAAALDRQAREALWQWSAEVCGLPVQCET
jgi:retinol dehydrogenase-12/retinol dehydrogenase-13